MPEGSDKTRIYVSGRKAPIVVDSQFDSVVQNITEAVHAGEPFVNYESAGRRFREGRVAIRVEKIVGLREDLVEEAVHTPADLGEELAAHLGEEPPGGLGEDPAGEEEGPPDPDAGGYED